MTPAEREAAVRGVRTSIAAMPDVLRAGVGMASRAAGIGLFAMAGRRFSRLPEGVRAAQAQQFTEAILPGAAELTRLARGLGIAECYEQRTAELLRRAGGPR